MPPPDVPRGPGESPTILALDFDGVLCEGAAEYFESSRRTAARVWPGAVLPGDAALDHFRALRPVIETGWEMPVLLRAMADGVDERRIATAWAETRDSLLGRDGQARKEIIAALKRTLDEVRREWIAADRADWLGRHATYLASRVLARVLGEPGATYVVTTKEGEFARAILADWGVGVAGVHGKETGSHKCDNLRQLIADHRGPGQTPPTLWFVEDRLETLRCATTHEDLAGVGLFLATWGYNTEATRASVADDPRIRPLSLERFGQGVGAWPR